MSESEIVDGINVSLITDVMGDDGLSENVKMLWIVLFTPPTEYTQAPAEKYAALAKDLGVTMDDLFEYADQLKDKGYLRKDMPRKPDKAFFKLKDK